MDIFELFAKIRLHPRAILMQGTMRPRTKNQGGLPGLTPHYAVNDCPLVVFDGANAVPFDNAAEIEFIFQEASFPLPSVRSSYTPKQGNLVQIAFGREGLAPSQAEYRVLREASTLLAPLVGSNRSLFVVTLPIMVPGTKGVSTGRHALVGVFDENGSALWLRPEAIQPHGDQPPLMQVDFPATQRERSVAATEASAPQAQAPVAGWYEIMRTALASTGLKGELLHEAILKARANQLVEQGIVLDQKAGLALAKTEAPTHDAKGAAPTPAAPQKTPRTGTGMALMGRDRK